MCTADAMEIHEDTFIKLSAGNYGFGLETSLVCCIDEAVFSGTMKRPYLYNATPAGSVHIHEVYISKKLVTVSGFRTFIEATGYVTEAEKEGWGWTWEDGGWNKKGLLTWKYPFRTDADLLYSSHADMLPVLQVSWNDAAAYCSWMSGETGRCVRIPTEKEWEACAELQGVPSIMEYQNPEVAGCGEPFIPLTADSYINQMIAIFSRDTLCHPPGIVWEWCGDWFDAYPGGPENREFGETYKVLRGGSLNSSSLQRAREYRFRRCPTARSPFYGFRTAFSADT